MFVVACARCQNQLTDTRFAHYADAQRAADALGCPAGDGCDELWCTECAQAYQRQSSRYAAFAQSPRAESRGSRPFKYTSSSWSATSR